MSKDWKQIVEKLIEEDEYPYIGIRIQDEASEVVLVVEHGDSAIYALKGSSEGSKAVRIVWGYAVGDELGWHSFCEAWAVAELGSLDEDMDFVPDAYTDEDMYKTICSKSAIGTPKAYKSFNPPAGEGEIDWESFYAWSRDAANGLISE